MDIKKILLSYYKDNEPAFQILWAHSCLVANKAIAIAQKHPELSLDLTFIHQSALLHDIGIIQTRTPEIECYGSYPYICHGYLGHDMLVENELPKHALVCERHTGVGLSIDEIIKGNLPLPHRDMRPQTPEEQIVCLADKFYSKSKPNKELSLDLIRTSIAKHGEQQQQQLDELINRYL